MGALLADIPKPTEILTHHVIAGTAMTDDVIKMDGQSVKIGKGADLTIRTTSSVKLYGTTSVLSSKCGFATLFDPHGGRGRLRPASGRSRPTSPAPMASFISTIRCCCLPEAGHSSFQRFLNPGGRNRQKFKKCIP